MRCLSVSVQWWREQREVLLPMRLPRLVILYNTTALRFVLFVCVCFAKANTFIYEEKESKKREEEKTLTLKKTNVNICVPENEVQ